MGNDIRVDCLTEEICDVIQEIAVENGVRDYTGQGMRFLYLEEGMVSHCNDAEYFETYQEKENANCKQVSIEEFVERITSIREELFIGDSKVVLMANGDLDFNGNCLDKKDVLKIIEKYQKFNS